MNPNDATELYRRLKLAPPARLRSEGHAAMVRFSEQQVVAKKKHLEENRRRLEPVYRELVSALRKSSDLASVVRAIDALDGKSPRRSTLPPAEKRLFVPEKPLIRIGSTHIVDTLPFFSDTWTWQEGDSNNFFGPLSADGTAGNMSFGMQPGTRSSGHMACWAAVGAAIAIPNRPCQINLTANPSVSWDYGEYSSWWRQAAGNMWAGQFANLFDANGSLVSTAVKSQVSVASFDDRNFSGSGSDSGSNSAMPLSAGILIGVPPFGSPPSAEGGFMQYWCWIGGSCNADGSDGQSNCSIEMNANCSSLTVDIFEF